jgi:predicted TIM-barrel fold metal-dependent hydrolase
MALIAKNPNAFMKLSMLVYTDPSWSDNQVVVDAVKKAIDLFGSERCMFASNFPVDVF